MPATRIFISALQAYCRATRLAVTLKRHGDIYTVTDSDVRCRYLSDQSASLDPRLVFPLEGGLAYIRAGDLQALGDGAEFRLQEIEKDGTLSLALRARTWDELAAEMAAKIGREALEANHTGALADLLLALGTVSEADIGKVVALSAPDETLGSAIVRLGAAKLEAVLEALIGPAFLFRQPPAGEPIALPQADRAGEQLYRKGLVSRSDLLHYELLAGKQHRDYLELLREEGRITAEQAHDARWREDLKLRARTDGAVPLGEIVVMRGWLSQEALDDFLAQQAMLPDHKPLGHLLVDRGILSPEALAEALRTQDERIEALVEREIKGEDPAHKPGFRRPQAAPVAQRPRKTRRRLSAVTAAIAGVGLIAALSYVAYYVSRGSPIGTSPPTPTPGPLAFLQQGAGTGKDAYMTIADVRRSAGGTTRGQDDDLENPEYVDETADLEEYVASQQADLEKFQKSAKVAVRAAAAVSGGRQLALDGVAGAGSGQKLARQDRAGGGARAIAREPAAPQSTEQSAGTPATAGGPASGGDQPAAPPADAALNTQALLDVANGSYADARKTLAEAVKQQPHNPMTLFNLGLCDYQLGQHAQALSSFSRARTLLDAGAGNLERLAGPALSRRVPPASASIAAAPPGNPEAALRALIRAWSLQADTITYQGHSQAALGKQDLARRLYREALPYFRRKAAAQTALGDLQRGAGNVKAAIGSYSAAARMDTRYPDPWLALYAIAREQGQDGLATRYKGIHDRLASRR